MGTRSEALDSSIPPFLILLLLLLHTHTLWGIVGELHVKLEKRKKKLMIFQFNLAMSFGQVI